MNGPSRCMYSKITYWINLVMIQFLAWSEQQIPAYMVAINTSAHIHKTGQCGCVNKSVRTAKHYDWMPNKMPRCTHRNVWLCLSNAVHWQIKWKINEFSDTVFIRWTCNAPHTIIALFCNVVYLPVPIYIYLWFQWPSICHISDTHPSSPYLRHPPPPSSPHIHHAPPSL